jgi:hypothetical protein
LTLTTIAFLTGLTGVLAFIRRAECRSDWCTTTRSRPSESVRSRRSHPPASAAQDIEQKLKRRDTAVVIHPMNALIGALGRPPSGRLNS